MYLWITVKTCAAGARVHSTVGLLRCKYGGTSKVTRSPFYQARLYFFFFPQMSNFSPPLQNNEKLIHSMVNIFIFVKDLATEQAKLL